MSANKARRRFAIVIVIVVVIALMLIAIFGLVNHLRLSIKQDTSNQSDQGTVVISETIIRESFGVHARCHFRIELGNKKKVIDCGQDLNSDHYCPGSLDLCNEIRSGMQVRVEYVFTTTTDNSIFGSGKPVEHFGRVNSIQLLKED